MPAGGRTTLELAARVVPSHALRHKETNRPAQLEASISRSMKLSFLAYMHIDDLHYFFCVKYFHPFLYHR
jgi:hypothetical protein